MAALPAWADLNALVVSEPTSRKDVLMVSRTALETQLARAAGQPVNVVVSDDLTDAMRATRSKGYDLYVAPAQVAASAIAHGHELVGATDGDDDYVLVGRASLPSLEAMRQGRIYLPQQDSLYTYLARGMLNAGGLSFKDLGHVTYARYPQAGLSWDVTRWLTLALVYRHRFQLDLDQAFNIRADIGTPGEPPAIPNATLNERARAVDLYQPWQLVLGAALRPSRRTVISYDVTFARYAEAPTPATQYDLTLDVGKLNDQVKIPPSKPYPPAGFHDLLIPALGVEHRLLEGALGDRLDLDLRGGYRYEPTPVPRQDGESSFADTDKHTFSVGAGVTLRRLPQVLPQPLSLDVFVAVTALPPRSFQKADPRSPVGDFTMTGAVPQTGAQIKCRF